MDEAVSAAPTPVHAESGFGGAAAFGERTVVAGVGCRAGANADQVLAALDAALAAFALPRRAVVALATIPQKRNEPALKETAAALGLPLLVPDAQALADVSTPTRSPASLSATGLGSAAEASALAAIGQGACLLGPRVALGSATCALGFLDRSAS